MTGFLEDTWLDQFPPLVRGLVTLAVLAIAAGGFLLILWLGGPA